MKDNIHEYHTTEYNLERCQKNNIRLERELAAALAKIAEVVNLGEKQASEFDEVIGVKDVQIAELEKQGAGMFLRGVRHAQMLIETDDPCCTLEVLQNDPESYRKGKSHAVGVISNYLKG